MEVHHMKKRKLTLTKLFWHYLLTVGISFVCILVMMVLVVRLLLSLGVVFPANTADAQTREVEDALLSGQLLPEELPSYYRWSCFDETGKVIAHSDLSARRQEQICAAVEEKTTLISDVPFAQYHRFIALPNGSLFVLQYDFSMPYAVPWMQHYLPDCQILVVLLFVISVVLMIVFWTKRYARKLYGDTMVLTAAAQAITEHHLDAPFQNDINIREFEEILQAMDLLRISLSDSLHEQWSMEQQRTREIAALAHDLKTPLTVISGNGELLAEEGLSDSQRKSVDAILRNAGRMEASLSQLRSVVVHQSQYSEKETVDLQKLFSEWVTMGEELCASKQISLVLSDFPQGMCHLEVPSVNRAVQNLLDNAVRYTPQGGKICLSAKVEDSILNISVQDSGPGFTEEAIAHGCEVFFMEDRSRQGTEHMGMGLYNVQCVAHRHNGTVILSNTESGGIVTLQLYLTE